MGEQIPTEDLTTIARKAIYEVMYENQYGLVPFTFINILSKLPPNLNGTTRLAKEEVIRQLIILYPEHQQHILDIAKPFELYLPESTE